MKRIILTGSSSGFGWLTAKTLAKQGHIVYATMRNVTTTNAAVAQTIRQWAIDQDVAIRVVELDVTSDASVQQAMAEIADDANGQIDVLINNAGIVITGLNESLSAEQANQIFQVNVLGADRMIKAVLPYMHAQKSGLLMHLSSGLARLHLPLLGVYSASKAAIDALAETYHYELRALGIDSVIVQPGAYPTTDLMAKQINPANPDVEEVYGETILPIKRGIAHMFTPTEKSPDPQEVADLIARLVETPAGQRPLWNAIGISGIQPYVEQLNQTTQQLAATVFNAIGVTLPA
ncbi:SDR family NAD(P)-dependent oxidoreductase [Spirosoma aureum]|uniref:SDR family NAD(P)-dependent oxidoreductase n=1 Tax=Spirosoma aureum TaxID=2692134 RepID=A0A6G9AQA7_9BACT|nr:SDR family NAD(P)-dependent oxidoreductase [Spirosoma aureum]QIP14590.1 SDR family NAD(P)-dependent oxidoreductase [Spirosoma aureum]